MFAILLLSADSAFAGAILRCFGIDRRNLNYACWTMGVLDGSALLLGYALRILSGMRIHSVPDWLWFCGTVLLSVALAKAVRKFPRVTILAFAVLFSLDNLLAGMRFESLASVVWAAALTGIFATLFSRAGFEAASVLISNVKVHQISRPIRALGARFSLL